MGERCSGSLMQGVDRGSKAGTHTCLLHVHAQAHHSAAANWQFEASPFAASFSDGEWYKPLMLKWGNHLHPWLLQFDPKLTNSMSTYILSMNCFWHQI
eukprot:1159086-Pelagomonas_calceolata.AAC.7